MGSRYRESRYLGGPGSFERPGARLESSPSGRDIVYDHDSLVANAHAGSSTKRAA